jgi:hypothetical protein
MLAPAKAYEEWVSLLSGLAGAFDTPAILDAVTGHWLQLEQLDDLAHDPPGQPPVESLWVIHAVFDKSKTTGTQWLHTHGLWRCGRPELEMLEVPAEHAGDAGRLLNSIAALVLDEEALPAPGETYSIGPEIDVTLHPWQALMGQVSRGTGGGAADRAGDDNPHAGVRAVVCGPQPIGAFRKQWVWPREAAEFISHDRAVLYHSERETQRAANLARGRWGELATAFAAAPSGEPKRAVFTVKAAFAQPGAASDALQGREHMWIEVHEFRGDSARGELINQPLQIASLKRGEILTICREDVSDWKVFTPAGAFAPTDVPALWRTLDVMKDPQRAGTLPRRRRSLHGIPRDLVQGDQP